MKRRNVIPVILFSIFALVMMCIVWLIGYRVGLARGELIQYTSDTKYVEELQKELQYEKEEVHTCPFCNKLFIEWE